MKKLLLFLFLAGISGSRFLYATSDKLLDNYSSSTLFYMVGMYGNLTPSIDYTTYSEGNSSLRLSYTLDGVTGNLVEVFRNYSTSTQDLSFQPHALTIMVKGNVGNSDVFKFMLYEDHNMNGYPFDAGDEVYEFVSPTILSSSSWTLLTMPYTSFTKFGGGAGTLDLSRIGAWRIVVTNAGTASTNEFYVDDLRQVTNYTAPSSGTVTLGGSFIQLWNTAGCSCGQWTQEEWEDQFQSMKDACLDKLVIQYGVYENNAWYTPSSLGYVAYTNPTLGRIFAAAQIKGIDIYLGLYFDETWNSSDKTQSSTYSSLLTKQQQVTDELWDLFSGNTRFKGWYIPQEINDLEWQSTGNQSLLASYLQSVASYAKGKDNSKKVLIAPFFGPNRPADNLQSWWETTLETATDVDIVYVQDGVGTTTKDVDTDIPHYFAAIKQACENKGRVFGATIETFQQTDGWPINANTFAAVPVSINRLTQQLREAGLHTDELLQFEWAYMQPSLSAETQTLYDDYLEYADCSGPLLTISKKSPTAVTEAKNGIVLYPVPFHETLFLKKEEGTKIHKVKVYDSKGSLVFQSEPMHSEVEIVLPASSEGLFMISIIDADTTITLPVVKE